jgi:hypothetical protein
MFFLRSTPCISWTTGIIPKDPAKPAFFHKIKKNNLYNTLEYFLRQNFCNILYKYNNLQIKINSAEMECAAFGRCLLHF